MSSVSRDTNVEVGTQSNPPSPLVCFSRIRVNDPSLCGRFLWLIELWFYIPLDTN